MLNASKMAHPGIDIWESDLNLLCLFDAVFVVTASYQITRRASTAGAMTESGSSLAYGYEVSQCLTPRPLDINSPATVPSNDSTAKGAQWAHVHAALRSHGIHAWEAIELALSFRCQIVSAALLPFSMQQYKHHR